MVNKKVFTDFAKSFRYDRGRHNSRNFCEGFHELLRVAQSMNDEIETLKAELKELKGDKK